MKLINKIFLLGALIGLVAFIGCSEDDLVQPTPSPDAPAGTQGVYFPKSNKSAFEFMPVDPTEFTLTIARSVSEGAVDVPLTQEVNDDNVFVVPASVSFASGETEATFKVTFPDADVGKVYNLKLTVEGDQFVNPYVEGVPYLETNVMRVKWEPLKEPMVYVDGTFLAWFGVTSEPMYVYAEKAVLGKITRYRFKNAYKVPTAFDSEGNAIPDEDGIYDGYPYNEPGDFDESKDYLTTIEIGGDKGTASEVFMYTHQIGVEWAYGMHAIGSVYGNLTVGGAPAKKDEYPLGVLKDSIITFPESSLYHQLPTQGIRIAADPTTIYLSKEVYLKANKAIKDFNDLEYVTIEGEESIFASKAFADSWEQTLGKAVDVDEENEESAYKNLYFLADLYSEGKGVAFYYNEESGRVTIPENQPIGATVFGQDLYVSASTKNKSSVVVKDNGLTEYTLGMIFHYEDGTIVGDFAEKFLYSEDAVSFEIDDFTGDFLMSGFTPFTGRDDAEGIPIKIALGENDNELVITGLRYAKEIIATFDPLTSIMSIAPQPLEDTKFNNDMINASLISWILDGNSLEPSTTAIIELETNLLGDISLSAYSEAIGYGIETTDLGGGFLDGYYFIDFTRSKSASAASLNSFDASVSKIQSINSIVRNIESKEEKVNNFKVQGKKSAPKNKELKKSQPGAYIFR